MLSNYYTFIPVERQLPSFTYERAVSPTTAEKAPTYTNGQTWKNTVTGVTYALKDATAGTWVTFTVAPTAPKSWRRVTSIKGFIQEVNSDSQFIAGKDGQRVTARLYTNIDTVLQYTDRLTWYGRKFIVLTTGGADGVSGTGHHNELLLGDFN